MNQKTFTLILIALVVTLGGYFLYQQQTKSTPTTQAAAQSTVTADETANPDSIGANWKTYTNSDYNFSLKYPQKFTLKVDYASAEKMAYQNDGSSGLYQLWFYTAEEGVEKYSAYSINLYTSPNKTLSEQFSNLSLKPLSDNHGANEAASVNYKSNEPGTINENFTILYFRVKDTFFVITPTLQDASAADKIWNYPVLETLQFAN